MLGVRCQVSGVTCNSFLTLHWPSGSSDSIAQWLKVKPGCGEAKCQVMVGERIGARKGMKAVVLWC